MAWPSGTKKGDEKAPEFCDSYGNSVDFTDRALLEPVLEFARSVNDKKGQSNASNATRC